MAFFPTEAGTEVQSSAVETRLSGVQILAHKAHSESSIVTYSVPTAPVLKRKADGHSDALQGEAVTVITRLKCGLTRYMSVKQGFDIPDLIFPFHYFP